MKKERLTFWLVLMAFVLLIVANILNISIFSHNPTSGRASSQASISLIVGGTETPEASPTPTSSGGGGGGGGSIERKQDFSVDTPLLAVLLHLHPPTNPSILKQQVHRL